MGWLISHDLTKKQQVAELVKGWEHTNKNGKVVVQACLDHSTRGNTLYGVFEVSVDGVATERYIAIFMLRKDRGYGWGYKDLTEAMGPFQYDCPLKFLKMVPEVKCEKWRELVRAHHEKRRKRSSETIEPGTVFQFAKGFKAAGGSLDGEEAKILRKQGRGWIAQLEHTTIKVMRRHIGEVLFQTA